MSETVFIKGLRGLEIESRTDCSGTPRAGCVATIGSFDGVHLGHQNLLKTLKALAAKYDLPSVVVLFEPQPHEYFSKEKAPARLMRLREKVCTLLDYGVDQVLCLRFDRDLCSLSAEAYIQRVLVDGLAVKHLVVGDDFRFGCDRTGDYAMLKREGEKLGFSVRDTNTLLDGSQRVSSTRIRNLLENDALDHAKKLLGRPFSVTGRVIYGKQLGQVLGFPTANVGLGRYRSPVKGVYAVEVTIDSVAYKGVANVGVRPTVGGLEKPILEIHLLDLSEQLYGKFLSCVFLQKLREEKTFSSLDDLKKNIQIDVDVARDFFENI